MVLWAHRATSPSPRAVRRLGGIALEAARLVSMTSRPSLLASFCLTASLLLAAGGASAQDEGARPSAVLLESARAGVDEGTAGAFDRLLRQRLDALEVVQVDGSVVLDLEQLQIALGCMGETSACLSAVASELETQLVLVPSLSLAGTELVSTVLLFDARDGSQRRALRRGDDAAAILETVDGQLRELFDLPPPVAPPAEQAPSEPAPPPEPGLSAGPFVLMGIGVAALIGGGAVAAMAQGSADQYRASMPGTSAEVDATLDTLSRAQVEATVANALFVAGGLLAAGGVVWLLAAGREDGASPLAIAPVIAPGQVGIMIAGELGGSL